MPVIEVQSQGKPKSAFGPREEQIQVWVAAAPSSFADALAEFTGGLEQYSATADLGTRHARLALNHGLAVHRASLQWAEHTTSVDRWLQEAVRSPTTDGPLRRWSRV